MMQNLDNFGSYEADAVREHFEDGMKKAVEENGRRRVEILLDAYKPAKGDEKKYAHFTEVRNVLMSIYPKIDNHSDRRVQQITIDEWEMQAKLFDDYVNKKLSAKNENGANGIEMKAKKEEKTDLHSADQTV